MNEVIERQERRYLVWRCVPSTELRGRRSPDSGCLMWSVRSTNKPLKGMMNAKMQAICKHCNNRPRLDAKNLYQFEDKYEAEIYCTELNGEE